MPWHDIHVFLLFSNINPAHMRLFLVTLLNLLFLSKIAAQHEIDSLKRLLTGREDTTQVLLLGKIGVSYYNSNNKDSMYEYLQRSVQLAEELHFTKGEMALREYLGEVLFRTGNYTEALKISLESVKKAEQLKDTDNLYWNLRNVMMTYEYLPGEEKQIINYAEKIKAIVYSGFFKDPQERDLRDLIGYINHAAAYYDKIGNLDSTLYFRQRSYEISQHLKDPQGLAIAIGKLASTHEKLGNHELAFTYYKMNLHYAKEADRFDILSDTKLALAQIFQKRKQLDSAFYYTRESLADIEKSGDPSGFVDVYSTLSDLYKGSKRYDSSYKYLKLKVDLKDSLFSQEKIKNIENQSFTESIRQQEMAKQKEKEKAERKQNIQLSAVAIFIILFFLFVLLLSHKKKNVSLIGFLGMLSILMIFEFIAMLSHPYIEEWTHHNPILMLMILVAIASILVPMHHRLDHWIKKRSVTKYPSPR